MGRTLTVFILHCGNDLRNRPEKTAENLEGLVGVRIVVVPPGFRDLNALHADTDWKMFLFSDEWLSNQLVEVLPLYLDQEMYNVLSAYRLVEPDNTKAFNIDDLVVSICPRLFKSEIPLKNMAFEWDSSITEIIRHSSILDGFIVGAKE